MQNLTWLFDHKQDGLTTGLFIVLEALDTVVLVFIGAVDCIFVMEDWCWEGENVSIEAT